MKCSNKKALHTSRDTNTWQKHRKNQRTKLLTGHWQSTLGEKGEKWSHPTVMRNLFSWRFPRKWWKGFWEQPLLQSRSREGKLYCAMTSSEHILGCQWDSSYKIICAPFVKHILVLRDNELYSHRLRCCCCRRWTWCPFGTTITIGWCVWQQC